MEELLGISPLTGLGIGSGWAIVCVLVLMLFRGTLVTRREVDAKDRHIEYLTKACETKDEQLSLVLKETAPTLTTFLEDVRDAARFVRSGEPDPPEVGR